MTPEKVPAHRLRETLRALAWLVPTVVGIYAVIWPFLEFPNRHH